LERPLISQARETLKTQELELFKLRSILQELESADAENKQETQVLKEKIAEMTSENHRLEDELEIRLQEISELRDELRELQKSKVEYLQLTENEVSFLPIREKLRIIAATTVGRKTRHDQIQQ
jgi:predicted nuclease with TOPRIM domain